MITVAHEALIDLIVDADGHVDPRLGGAGFNVTRAVAPHTVGHDVEVVFVQHHEAVFVVLPLKADVT